MVKDEIDVATELGELLERNVERVDGFIRLVERSLPLLVVGGRLRRVFDVEVHGKRVERAIDVLGLEPVDRFLDGEQVLLAAAFKPFLEQSAVGVEL